MNDLLIECFRAATDTLNFTVAAQKIHMSQPAFSRNIAALEEEVGFKLFWRSKQNGSRLTPAGAVLYNGLFDIERQYNDLLEKAKQISRGEEGKLVIGILGGVCLDSKSFQHITMFRQRYPQVEVELKSGCEEAAEAYARDLAERYGLVPEESSKFRRALALAKGETEL